MISRVHSFLLNLHGHWEVRDNRSVNGIFVNDRKVQEAVLKDGDVVVFGGGGDHPIGAIIEQPDSEFRYEFRINTHWNNKSSKETVIIEEDDSEEDTLDGGSDSRNPNDNLMFEMDPTAPTPPSCVTLDTSATANTTTVTVTSSTASRSTRSSKSAANSSSSDSSSSEQHHTHDSAAPESSEVQQSNSKKSKSHRLPDSEATSHASKPSSSSSGATSKASSAHAPKEWPSGPESKKVFLGPTPTPDMPHRPILSAATLLSDIDEGARSSGAEGSAGTQSDELRQSESSSVAANQADAASSTSAGQEHEIDDESKARIAHLQTELHQACEERRRLPPIYRAPEDSDLSCKLCRNLIFNPTTMGCGHTFCDSCVEFLVIENPKCPECGASVAPPILSSQTLKQEVIAVVRDWSRADQTAWVAYMTRRNEAIRYAGLELLLESFRARGVRFVNIEERWSDSDRYAFAEGIDVYSLNSRMAFCRAVGLTASWVQNATFDMLLLALGNLGLNLTVPIIRARARAASLPYDSLQDEPEEETRYWSDSSSSSSSSTSASSDDDKKAALLGIDDEIAFHLREGAPLDAEAEDAEERSRRLASRRGIIVDEAERLEREAAHDTDDEEALEEGSKRKKSKRAPRRLSIVEPDLAVPPALLPTANLGELDTPIPSARRHEKIPEEDEEGSEAPRSLNASSTKKSDSAMDVDGEIQPTAVDEHGVLASSSATPAVITFHDLIVEAMREEIMQYIIQNRRQFMHYQASQRMRLYYDQHPDPRHQPPHPPPQAYAQPIPGVAPLPGDAQRAAAATQREVPEEGTAPAPQRAHNRRYFHLGARLGQSVTGEANPLQPLHQLLTDLQGAQRVLPPAAPTTPIPPIVIRPRPAALQAHFGNPADAAHHHHHHHRHGGGAGNNQHGPGIRNPHLILHDPGHLLQPDQAPPARPDLGHAQVLMRAPPADPPQGEAAPRPNNDEQNQPDPNAK